MQSRLLPLFAAILCATGASGVHAKKAPVELGPTSAWNIDYSEDSCALRRLFGDPGKQVLLEMRYFGYGTAGAFLSLRTDGWRTTGDRYVRYRFGQGDDWQEGQAMYATFGRKFRGLFMTVGVLPPTDGPSETAAGTIDPTIEARLEAAYAAATSITVADAFDVQLTLRTGSLEQPHEAVRACLDELLTHWGIDAVAHRSLTRSARPQDMEALARAVQRDYPMSMLAAGRQGLVRVRLSIDATGQVTDCRIQQDMSEAAFDKATCKNLVSAKFEPALDKDGNAIESYWITSVSYLIN